MSDRRIGLTLVQVSVRVDPAQWKRARRALAARTTSETIQRALGMVAEKAAHDRVIRKYSGAGSRIRS